MLSRSLDFCERNNLLCASSSPKPFFDTEKKRVVKGALKTQTLKGMEGYHPETVKASDTIVCLKSKKYVVIDVDILGNQTPEEVIGADLYTLLYNASNVVVRTGSGGVHFWFRNNGLKSRSKIQHFAGRDVSGQLDIVVDSIALPGSSYEYGEDTYCYVYEKGSSLEEVGDMPTTIQQFCKEAVKPVPKEDSSADPKAMEPDSDISVRSLLQYLRKERFGHYDDWIRLGMILKNEGFSVQDWDTYSKQCPSYKTGLCQSKWKTFSTDGGLTQATVWKWLKEDDPKTFERMSSLRTDLMDLFRNANHYGCAKLFYNLVPFGYSHSPRTGWYELTSSNRWNHSKKCPTILKNHLSRTFQELVLSQKEATLEYYRNRKSQITDSTLLTAEGKKEMLDLKAILVANKLFGSADFVNGMIQFLENFYLKEDLISVMDMNRYLFAFSDKVVELKTGAVRDLQPLDWISTTTGYAYPTTRDKSTENAIRDFIYGIWEDEAMATYMIEILAMSLIGYNRAEEYYTLSGKGGNGKGVLNTLVQRSYGDYYMSIDSSLLTKPSERKDAPCPALYNAKTKRILVSTEPEANDTLQTGFIKKITGNDDIEVRTLYDGNILIYKPQFTLFLQCNTIPKLSKVDGGITRRLRIVHFPFQFVADMSLVSGDLFRQANTQVKEEYCMSDEWRDSFIHILLDTLAVIGNQSRVKPPPAVADATTEYLDRQNPLKEWLAQYFLITNNPNDTIPARDMRLMYMDYRRLAQCSDNWFSEMMRVSNGIESKRTSLCTVYVGIKARESTQEETPKAPLFSSV